MKKESLNESMYDEILASMSEDDALNAKIEKFRNIKNPDRIQKARLNGLLLEQKARQKAAMAAAHASDPDQTDISSKNLPQNETVPVPAASESESSQAADVTAAPETPADFRSATVQPEQPPFNDSLLDRKLGEQDAAEKKRSSFDSQISIPAFILPEQQEDEKAQPVTLRKEIPIDQTAEAKQPESAGPMQPASIEPSAPEKPEQPEAEPQPSLTEQSTVLAAEFPEHSAYSQEVDVPAFFHSDLEYHAYTPEEIAEMSARAHALQEKQETAGSMSAVEAPAEKRTDTEKRPDFTGGNGMESEAGEKEFSLFGKRPVPPLRHVYVDPATGEEWAHEPEIPSASDLNGFAESIQNPQVQADPVQGSWLQATQSLNSQFPADVELDPADYGNAGISGPDFSSPVLPETNQPAVYEDLSAPAKGGFRKFMTMFCTLLVAVGIGFGAWWYMDYMSPGKAAFRSFKDQIQSYAVHFQGLNEEDQEKFLALQDSFNELLPEQQQEVNALLKNTTGSDFDGMVQAIQTSRRKSELESQIADTAAQIDAYNDQIAQTSASLNEAQAQYKEAASAASSAKKDADKASKKVDSIQKEIESARTTIQDTSESIASLQQEIADMQADKSDIFGDFKLEMKQRSLTQKQNSLQAAQETLDKRQTELIQYQSEAQEAQTIYEQQQALADQLKAAVEQMQTDYASYSASLQEAQNTLDQLQKEMDSL